MTPAGLLTLALLAPAAPPAEGPKLQRGDEFIYTGTIAEAVDRPGTRFRRSHELEVRVFVLEKRETWAEAAVLTLVRRTDDAPVAGVLPEVTGAKREGKAPAAARLDLVRIRQDGVVHLLAPLGPAPLRFSPETPARLMPAPPLDSYAPFEFGMFAPRPTGTEKAWTVATTDEKRPAESWSVPGMVFIHSEQCMHLAMVQQAPDWDYPRGGQTSWQRRDDVWLSASGLARRVNRTILQRDGIAKEPAVRIDVKYDLKEQGRPIGRMYDRYRSDIETAYLAMTELGPLAKDAARIGAEPFRQRIARLDDHLEKNLPETPYREAVLAVRRLLDAASRGEAIHLPATGAEVPLPLPKTATPGRPAPDFKSGKFRLSEAQGKPVVLVFFMPGKETAEPALKIADAVQTKYGSKISVLSLAVFAPVEAGIRERDRLKVNVPVYDGTPAEAAYGIETFPRFFAIDSGGVLRWSFTGVGNETGQLVREQVENLLSPAIATGSPTAPGNPRPVTKP